MEQFLDACKTGDILYVSRALSQNPDGVEQYIETALIHAQCHGKMNVFRYIVDRWHNKINLNSVFCYSCLNGYTAAAIHVIERYRTGLDVSRGLILAANGGHMDLVEYLVENYESDLQPALEIAVFHERKEVAVYLHKQINNRK